jgi:hypothetical protein
MKVRILKNTWTWNSEATAQEPDKGWYGWIVVDENYDVPDEEEARAWAKTEE